MPPDETQETVRALHVAFRRRDLDGCAALLAPDVAWHAPSALPFGGALHGVDAVRGYLTDLWAFFEGVDLGDPELHGTGEAVMASGVLTVLTAGGERHELDYSQLFTVREGRVAVYRERSDAGALVRAITDELTTTTDAGAGTDAAA